jgi:hypothetical protein
MTHHLLQWLGHYYGQGALTKGIFLEAVFLKLNKYAISHTSYLPGWYIMLIIALLGKCCNKLKMAKK